MLRVGGVAVRRGVLSGLVPFVAPRHRALLAAGPSRSHLQFLARKSMLQQDAVLLAPADPLYARLLALGFAQLAHCETEYVPLTSETRAGDLQQMRALRDGSAVYEDGPAVRAALRGRILLLENMHHTESNVLPLLNSLLEGREMSLDDGRLIVSGTRFRKLLESNSEAALHRNGILQAHDDFRVIGISVPSKGTPLDPPLRSRLQARWIDPLPHNVLGEALSSVYSETSVKRAISAADALSIAAGTSGLPHGDQTALVYHLAAEFDQDASLSSSNAVASFYGIDSRIQELRKLFGEEALSLRAQSQPSPLEAAIKVLRANRAVTVSGVKGSGRRHLAFQIAEHLGQPVELSVVSADTSVRELFGARVGGKQNTSWQDSAFTRAMKFGSVAIVEGVGDDASSFREAVSALLQMERVLLPSGDLLVSVDHYEHLKESLSADELANVVPISPKFRVVFIHDASESASACVPQVPVVAVRALTLDEAHRILSQEVPHASADLAKSVARLVAELPGFTLTNGLNVLKLADTVPPLQVARDALFYRFLGKTDDIDAHLEPLSEYQPRSEHAAVFTPAAVQEGQRHLIPHVSNKFTENMSSERILVKIKAYLALKIPILLLGVQGTAKNILMDYCCERLELPRMYQQLHLDSTQESLWSQTTIENGQIVSSESPLLVAIRHGHVAVLDEIDKAPPAVISTLRALVSGMFRMPDGRVIASKNLAPMCGGSIDIEIHPNFQLVCLANPGVHPFLGNNVRDQLGAAMNAIIVDPPDEEAMRAVLLSYNTNPDNVELVSKIASCFSQLFHLKLDSGYTYGLREAISVTKDLQVNTNSLESALSNVFDYERTDTATRAEIAKVFQQADLPFDAEAFMAGHLREPTNVEIEQTSVRESQQDPKHGKDPDGKAHVGGNTWRGGTGGNSTAGLGGRHGPYRFFDFDAGHDIHQVDEKEKVWTDKAAEARARKMAHDALQQKLKEIDMSNAQFGAYEEYRVKVAPQVASLRDFLASLSTSKSTQWKRGQTDGQLDEKRLVEALMGESKTFKRLQRNQSSTARGSGKIFCEMLVDCSASMYRFQGFDRRLTRLLECVTLLMEAFDGVDSSKIALSLAGHSGEEKRVELLGDSGLMPTNVKERFDVLQRIVAHTQYCWSGDSTFLAVQEAIRLMEARGTDKDERNVFVFSDANFSRYNLSPKKYAQIVTQSPNVNVTSIFIGSLGDEAEHLRNVLPKGSSHVVLDTNMLTSVFQSALRKAVAKQTL